MQFVHDVSSRWLTLDNPAASVNGKAMDEGKLTRERIIREALALLREDGIEKLTMRKLAARLNIRAPTLYWYFPDRSSILRAIITSILAEAQARVAHCESWQQWLREFGLAVWTLNCETPYAALLLQSAELNDETVVRQSSDYVDEALRHFDVAPYIMHRAHSDIQALVMGWSVFFHARVVDYIHPAMDVEVALREGIDTILRRWEAESPVTP